MTQRIDTGFALRFSPWLAILFSGGLLMGALAFQHFGDMHPCQMCYWQRHAHKTILAIALFMLVARYLSKDGTWDKVFLLIMSMAFITSFGLAFWHTGVEYKWWDGPKTCSAIPDIGTINITDISKIFEPGVKLPSCSDAPWHLLKISMAGYNAFFSAIATVLCLGVIFKGNSYD
ncbi:MAG: hypothetical protein COA43_02385 [Robiginitomaculum sp.]|nr:MAG: hypothetical protein COA43_02385 [Robiginitomaculum sp.]